MQSPGKLSHSPNLGKLFIYPGNPGTGLIGENVILQQDNYSELVQFVLDKKN